MAFSSVAVVTNSLLLKTPRGETDVSARARNRANLAIADVRDFKP